MTQKTHFSTHHNFTILCCLILLLLNLTANNIPAYADDTAGIDQSASDVAKACQHDKSKIWFICSEPLETPTQSSCPSYAFLSVIRQDDTGQDLVYRAELPPDNICLVVWSFKLESNYCIFAVASRPLPGSLARNHLRVYKFDCADSRRPSLQFMATSIDGEVIPLQGIKATYPAFLVMEPTYEVIPKALPQRYRFRLYAWNGTNYFLKSITQTTDTYDTTHSALESFRMQLREITGDAYLLPDFVDGSR